jgi:RNA polymerase subunit RPABC4/transcription elongation factor Spt4
MKTKACTKCKEVYPKSSTYFHNKIIKQRLANGTITTYHSFRSLCKSCHSVVQEEKRKERRCQELNCDISEYQTKWKEVQSDNLKKDKVAFKNLTKSQYQWYINLKNKGFEGDYKDYLKRIEVNINRRNQRLKQVNLHSRKYFNEDEYKAARAKWNKNNIDRLTDSYIANNVLGVKVNDLPKEIIETKRLIIQLNRSIKNI